MDEKPLAAPPGAHFFTGLGHFFIRGSQAEPNAPGCARGRRMERKGGWDRDVGHSSRISPQLFTFPPFLPHYHPLRPPLPPFPPPDLYAAIPPKKFTGPRAVKPPPKHRKPRTQKQKSADMSPADQEKDVR